MKINFNENLNNKDLRPRNKPAKTVVFHFMSGQAGNAINCYMIHYYQYMLLIMIIIAFRSSLQMESLWVSLVLKDLVLDSFIVY